MLVALGYVWVYYWQQKMRRFGRQDLFDDKTADAFPCFFIAAKMFFSRRRHGFAAKNILRT